MKPSPQNDFDFRMFLLLKQFFERIYFGDILLKAVEREQVVFEEILENLKKYRPRKDSNADDKNKTLTSAQNFYDEREMIINAFKNKLFPLHSGNYYQKFKEESSESEDEMPDNDIIEQITKLYKFYGPDLISKYLKQKS